MDKNLENMEDMGIVEDIEESAYDLAEEDVDDSFDEDENYLDEDESFEDTEEEDDISEDDEEDDHLEDEDEEPKSTKKKKRKLSPAEIKLIALKKENKELKRRAKDRQEKKEAEALTAQYVDEGYDETTAKRYAKQDVEQRRLQTEVEALRFERDNADVFARYPDAKDRIDEIMQKAKAANMTADQVCRALFERPMPEHERKAMRAARGESTRETTKSGGSVARAARSASEVRDSLSRADRAFIRNVERTMNQGKPLSEEEIEIVMKRRR